MDNRYVQRLAEEPAVKTIVQHPDGASFTVISDATHGALPQLDRLLTRWSEARIIRFVAHWGNGATEREYEFLKPRVKFIDIDHQGWTAYFTDFSRPPETHPLDDATCRLFRLWLAADTEGVETEVALTRRRKRCWPGWPKKDRPGPTATRWTHPTSS